MWIRVGKINTRSILITASILICILFYWISVKFVHFLVNATRHSFDGSANDGRRGVNVIVAHYIGTGNLLGNLTKDLVNENHFEPVNEEGANGRPVVIPPREMLKMQQMFQINRFNLLASDRMPLNRTLPDVRKKKCILKQYPSDLPTTSVIIVFHNEAWSVLMRTVWSVINRSPRHLLKEVLLVDDASNRVFLKDSLDEYVAKLPVSTKVLRLKEREGLIAARLLGAKHSQGETLTFLDAHCECTAGWLEPLLARIKEDRTNVICPVIDIISDDNFGYLKSFELHRGGFNWQLHFRWYLLNSTELKKRSEDLSRPFLTPAMAGGLFTIDKKYFYEIGAYDEQMKIWGGDNLEMSFRIWQCGGKIEIHPCSHVGHLFRKSSPYTFPGGVNEILNENLARTALVWMDDWAEFFFKYFQISKSLINSLNVSDRMQLRQKLQCKSFKWYLDNIWPDNFFPSPDRFYGKILLIDENSALYKSYLEILKGTKSVQATNWRDAIGYLNKKIKEFKKLEFRLPLFCLQQPPNQGALDLPFGQAFVAPCASSNVIQEIFVIKDDGHIMTNENVCLDAAEIFNDNKNSTLARIVNCADSNRQRWTYDFKKQQIIHQATKNCLTVTSDIQKMFNKPNWSIRGMSNGNSGLKESKFNVSISPCMEGKIQKWMLLPLNWK